MDLRWGSWSASPSVWAARATSYFALQGAGLLLAYAWLGFGTSPDNFPPGLRLDPIHAGVHLIWGLIGATIGFFVPRFAPAFIFAFAIFYLGLAVLGTFTHAHFGMRLATGENVFHWIVGPLALLVALVDPPWRRRNA